MALTSEQCLSPEKSMPKFMGIFDRTAFRHVKKTGNAAGNPTPLIHPLLSHPPSDGTGTLSCRKQMCELAELLSF